MTVSFIVSLAILFGLALFLFNEIRRSPGPREWGHTPRWKKRIRVTLAVIPLLIACFFFWSLLIEPNRLVVLQEVVTIANWPKELDGLKVAVISDIHVGSWGVDDRKLRLIIERTNQQQPAMIVILGDFMTGNGTFRQRVEPEVFGPVLKDLRAPLGVYSVLGNHDWWGDAPRLRRALEANGIKVLEDEVVEVPVQGRAVWLAGLADLWTRPQRIEQTIAKTPVGAPIIALTHNPDIFPRVPQRVPLLLAGHTHAAQIHFPLIGPIVQPSNYGYVRAHYYENNHHLFVTSGIGNSIIPLRFGATPEIVLLTIRSQ